MKANLVISCPATSRSGYGDHSRDLIRSLIAMDKFNIQVLDMPWGNCPMDALSIKDIDIASRIITEQMKEQPDVWIQVSVPVEFRPIGKYNIGITAGIETTLCAAEWTQGCNRMDYIIVPSEHAKNVFKQTTFEKKDQNGTLVEKLELTTKIDVLFEGLDMSVFNKKPNNDFKLDIKEDFAFLYVGHWLKGEFSHDRKDTGGMIRTFLETFKNVNKRNQPALILKTSGATFSISDREDILKKIDSIKKLVDGNSLPNIYLIHGNLSQAELNNLYNNTKVKSMVSFTHGEGFGRPLLEFSVTGKPVIFSNWSGQIDFLTNYNVPLAGELKPVHKTAADNMCLKEARWFYVDYGYASGALKDVNNNYKKYADVSRKQTQYVKENFSLDKMTEKFTELIEANVPVIGVPATNVMSPEELLNIQS